MRPVPLFDPWVRPDVVDRPDDFRLLAISSVMRARVPMVTQNAR